MCLRQVLLNVIAVCCLSGGAPKTLRGEWKNSLKPTGQTTDEIVLVKNGKTLCSIQIATNATAMEKKAAEELQHWIAQITSAKPEITTSDIGPKVKIHTEQGLGEEGHRIAIERNDLLLAGGMGRGVVNAVYALLEEDLGRRFYTNEAIRLPKTQTLRVQSVDRTFLPKLRLRDPFYVCAFSDSWSIRNRTNAAHAVVSEEFGEDIHYDGLFLHTQAKLLPPDKYFQDDLEYSP
jgi:hypothetical protein